MERGRYGEKVRWDGEGSGEEAGEDSPPPTVIFKSRHHVEHDL